MLSTLLNNPPGGLLQGPGQGPISGAGTGPGPSLCANVWGSGLGPFRHDVVLHGGVFIYTYIYICTSCGNTASNKIIKLRLPCTRPMTHGLYNLRAYAKGRAPRGFPQWPYRSVHSSDKVVFENIQGQINNIAKAYALQKQIPESMSESENTSDDDIPQDQYCPPSDGSDSGSD